MARRRRWKPATIAALEPKTGDLSDDQYRTEKAQLETQIAALPGGNDRLATFDRNRQVFPDFARNIDAATPAQRQELVALVVERAVAVERVIATVEWSPPAAPFFAEQQAASLWRPRRDSNPRRPP